MYLGLDIGNKTIKAVLLSSGAELMDWVCLENLGIISTLQDVLSRLKNRNPEAKIVSCGLCGAGRHFVSKLLGVNFFRTEIMSFYRGCLNYFEENPQAARYKSFIAGECGGEDAKIMIIERGLIKDFAMNDLCGAGLGINLENVAYRMGIKIEEFGDIALKSQRPLNVSSKCGVFCVSSCVSLLNQGASIENILSGVARSLVRNFLGLYKGGFYDWPFIFAGGVALNKAVCFYLQEELNKKIIVPHNPLILSAKGIALLAKDDSTDKGFDIEEFLRKTFKTDAFSCMGCENNCQITALRENGEVIAYFGSKCGRYK